VAHRWATIHWQRRQREDEDPVNEPEDAVVHREEDRERGAPRGGHAGGAEEAGEPGRRADVVRGRRRGSELRVAGARPVGLQLLRGLVAQGGRARGRVWERRQDRHH
jgi:hypothetical protein